MVRLVASEPSFVAFATGKMRGKLGGEHKRFFSPTRLAEAVRFELTEDSHPRRFSRPVP